MILVDTSVWVDHLRLDDPMLGGLLTRRQVLAHPFVIGELALGSMRQRHIILGALRALPQSPVARDEEVQGFVERHELFGLGIGYVDAHLLAGTLLHGAARFWTRDRRLRDVAIRLGVEAALDQ